MYASITDIKKIIPEQILIDLTDDENQGTVNDERISESINDADAEIDLYCEKNYANTGLPFNPVPQIIQKISVDIAVYNVFSRRSASYDMPATVENRYKNAKALLEDIATGAVVIGTGAVDTQGSGGVLTEGGQVFTRETLKGF